MIIEFLYLLYSSSTVMVCLFKLSDVFNSSLLGVAGTVMIVLIATLLIPSHLNLIRCILKPAELAHFMFETYSSTLSFFALNLIVWYMLVEIRLIKKKNGLSKTTP